MPSDSRPYRHYTDDELAVAFTAAKSAFDLAQFTSLTGGGKSEGMSVVDAQTKLDAVNREKDFRAGTGRAVNVVQDMSGYK